MSTLISTDNSNKPMVGLTNLFLVVTLLLVFLMASRTPLDTDMWWHLRSGQYMVETGKPLLTDVFSYTRAGADWTNHSWLGEVLLYGIYQLTGWIGLSAWMGISALLIAWFIWLQIPGGVYVKTGFVLLASVVSAPLWTPRPQLFSLVFFAALTWLVNGWLEKGGRRIWLVLPLFVVWSNVHGGFVLGVLFLLSLTVGIFLDALFNDKTIQPTGLFQAKTLAVSALGGYALAAINPNGTKMWLIPFETVGVGVLRQFIQEWASPDFHSPEVWPFVLVIMLLLVTQSLNTKRGYFRFLIPGCFFILLALFARRNIAVSAIVVTPWLATSWLELASNFNLSRFVPEKIQQYLSNYRNTKTSGSSTNLTRNLNLGITALLGLVCFLKLAGVTNPTLVDAFNKKTLPVDATAFLKSLPANKGQIFNSYNWGGYLIFNYPEQKVFVDGRTDLFGDEILGEWLTIVQAGDGWEVMLGKWGITRVLIEPDRPLAKVLPYHGWIEMYRDRVAVIFEKADY